MTAEEYCLCYVLVLQTVVPAEVLSEDISSPKSPKMLPSENESGSLMVVAAETDTRRVKRGAYRRTVLPSLATGFSRTNFYFANDGKHGFAGHSRADRRRRRKRPFRD